MYSLVEDGRVPDQGTVETVGRHLLGQGPGIRLLTLSMPQLTRTPAGLIRD